MGDPVGDRRDAVTRDPAFHADQDRPVGLRCDRDERGGADLDAADVRVKAALAAKTARRVRADLIRQPLDDLVRVVEDRDRTAEQVDPEVA